tara:strand:- start:51 stop:1355 length:1305 start_codon:yes stop_codon:yes gene_type:complete
VQRDKRTRPYPLSRLLRLSERNKLDIPDYQREEVWTKYQKQLLIDTIFRGYDIPKLYFVITNPEDGEIVKYRIADGQQRVKTILSFLRNEFKTLSESDPCEFENQEEEVANKVFEDFSEDLQEHVLAQEIDVVELRNYSEDEEKDIFTRMQMGTPLNAAEKRRGYSGNLPSLITKLSEHKIFESENFIDFSSKRYGFEDACAKIFHTFHNKRVTTITPTEIKKTYDECQDIDENNATYRSIKTSFDYLFNSLNGKSPKLKKYSTIKLPFIINRFREIYDIRPYLNEIGDAFLDFELLRKKDTEIQNPEDRDPYLVLYTNSIRADDLNNQERVDETLRREILKRVDLVSKDPNRSFTHDQKWIIYQRSKDSKGNFKCQADINAEWFDHDRCNPELDWETGNFHADHIVPHSRGGETKWQNGQALCIQCNLLKSDN